MTASSTTAKSTTRYIRLPQVCATTGTSSTTVWRWTRNNPEFPKPIRLSAGCTVWDEDELIAWIDARKAEREE